MASDVAVQAAPSHPQGVLLPPALARIAEAWPGLPPHIREAILTLIDATARVPQAAELSAVSAPTAEARFRDGYGGGLEETARRIARQCRHVVQACLREEEWQDADCEFFDIISEELLGSKKQVWLNG
jgi:hypothetical protein